MKILGLKPGHDGAIALIDGDDLVFSIEPEVDSNVRHSSVTTEALLVAFDRLPEAPEVPAVGGWHRVLPGHLDETIGGYRGLRAGIQKATRIWGKDLIVYSSSHERSHILGGVAMSGFVGEMAVLVWEGIITPLKSEAPG